MDEMAVMAIVISCAYVPISFAYHLRSLGMTGFSGCADRSRDIKICNSTDALRSRAIKSQEKPGAGAG